MRAAHWPELLTLLTVTAMPLTAQRAAVTATVTVQVPAVYRVRLVPGIVDAMGFPMVRVVTNVRSPSPPTQPLLKLPPPNYRLYLEHL